MREPGKAPQFDRMIADLQRAKVLWESGDKDRPIRILNVVASIALAEMRERGQNDPVPEVAAER